MWNVRVATGFPLGALIFSHTQAVELRLIGNSELSVGVRLDVLGVVACD